MAASDNHLITLFDIILDPKAYPGAPNPWKARYTLNYIGVPYSTQWVPLPDVAATRASLKLPANRAHHDGAAFPTLPVLRDLSSGTEILVGDSFDIALHLQHKHAPPSKVLFPAKTVALHRAFNAHVDAIFSQYGAPLAGFNMPFDPRTAEDTKRAMLDRMGLVDKRWEDLEIPMGSEVRNKMVKDFEIVLDTKLAGCFGAPGKVLGGIMSENFGEWRGAGVKEDDAGEGGPFMDGSREPVYGDFIVGGWLQFMRQGLPEWDQLRTTWSGGKWGKLFDALEEWEHIDGREGVVPNRR